MGETKTDAQKTSVDAPYEPPALGVIGTLQDLTRGAGGTQLPDEFEVAVFS
jgi:hypothetical protein